MDISFRRKQIKYVSSDISSISRRGEGSRHYNLLQGLAMRLCLRL